MNAVPGPSAPAGWYPDPDPNAMAQLRYWDGAQWTTHTSPVAAHPPAVAGPVAMGVSPPATVMPPDETLIRRLSEYSRWSGILWIVLGAVQIASVFGVVAGAWNVFAGITRIRMAGPILRREASVPAAFQGVAGLIVIGVINLLLGGVIGLVLVGVDFFVRDQVLKNAPLFTAAPAAVPGSGPASSPVPVQGG